MKRKSPDADLLPPLPPARDDPCWVLLARERLEDEYGCLADDDWRVLRREVEYWRAFCFSATYLRHKAIRMHTKALADWVREVQALTGWDRATVQERLRDVMGSGGIYS